jgi:CBS domain-containing protein
VLEDALMSNANTVREFMVREPVCASLWQPLSFIRQQMLKNSFTYLPLLSGDEGQPRWLLVSDYHVAHYLRQGDRKARLAKTLESAIAEDLILEQAIICFADTGVVEALEKSKGQPVIVVDREHPEQLVGIVTPFDLL